jgi:hypothetical protein
MFVKNVSFFEVMRQKDEFASSNYFATPQSNRNKIHWFFILFFSSVLFLLSFVINIF